MIKYYYTYEIYVDDSNSSLNGCYYFGKRESNKLHDDVYFGSGTLIRRYIKNHGTSKLQKTILEVFDNRSQLNAAEHELIETKRKELGHRCLNLHEGGGGGHWVEYSSPEHYAWRCKRVSEGMQNSHSQEFWVENAKHGAAVMHNMTAEERIEHGKKISESYDSMDPQKKIEKYENVSNGLKDYYKHASEDELIERKKKNKETNIESAKQWRSEFKEIFGKTPEAYRSKGLMKDALCLFKSFKESGNIDSTLISELEDKLVNAETIKITYTEERNNKLRDYQARKRRNEASFVYQFDGQEFYGEAETIRYIMSRFEDCKLYNKKLVDICLNPHKYFDKYPFLAYKISRKENLKNE